MRSQLHMQWGITLSSLLGKIEQVMAIGLSQHREQALDELALAGEDRACAGICVARIAIAIPGRAFPDVAGSDIENVSAGMSALPPFFEGERTMARIWVSRRWCSFQCPQCHAAIGHSEPKIAVVTPTHVPSPQPGRFAGVQRRKGPARDRTPWL